MRSKTVRWIVLTSSFLIAIIVGVQLIWLSRVFFFEQKTFNTNVVKSIRGLYEDQELVKDPGVHLSDLIEHPNPDYFLFRVDTVPFLDSVVSDIEHEFADFDVLTDAYLAQYHPRAANFVTTHYLSTAASRYAEDKNARLNIYHKPFPYFLLYFPHRKKYVLSQMTFWFASSGVLVIVLVALAVSLFYFYRQKFLAEVQKDFVNNFTHEFKTPLAVMKIAADVLQQNNITEKPEKLKNYANIINNQTNHLQNQVERLLQTASESSRQVPLEKRLVPINSIVTEAIKKIAPLIEEKKARMDIRLPENSATLPVDALHLELAIVNLLENALKYSSEPHIIVETGKENGYDFISVKDNGVGIDKKFIGKIFRKFYRVPTGNVHNVKGFGLGLNFVKRIVDAHNGKIVVNSLPGIGTEFKILLSNT